MRRLLLALLLLVALPTSTLAVESVPLPVPSPGDPVCPPVEWVDGVPVPPADAPADCVYIAGGGPTDPCAAGADGSVPPMCESGLTPEPSIATIRLIELASGERFTPIDATLTLTESSLSASVGCNQISGAATLETNGRLDLLQLLTTERYCADLAATEGALIAVLGGGDLRLRSVDDATEMVSSTGRIVLDRTIGAEGEATSSSLGLALLLLLLPLAAATVAILLALASRREEARR